MFFFYFLILFFFQWASLSVSLKDKKTTGKTVVTEPHQTKCSFSELGKGKERDNEMVREGVR